MKKNVFLLVILSLFILGCSEESVNNIQEESIDLQDNFRMAELMNDIVNDVDFQDLMTARAYQRSSNENNGVFVIENPFALIYGFPIEGNRVLILGAGFGDQYISFMPNGSARFHANTNDPVCFVLDLNVFEVTYSNNCYDDPIGHFNANVVGTYTELVLPFGTIYSIDEVQSADVLNGHTEVSDAEQVLDDDFQPIGCTDATEYKNARVHRVNRGNNGQGLEPIIHASLN